jgi:hypothetical protein
MLCWQQQINSIAEHFMSETDDLLDERETTHGLYGNTARIIQGFKAVLREELMQRDMRSDEPLSDVAVESLEMILHKIGRIISGKWDCVDHWADISGYADLTLRDIEEEAEWVEYKSNNLRDMEPDMEPDGYDWRADALGSYNDAIRAIGAEVKSGRRELPKMFRPRNRPAIGDDPGDETVF